MPIVALIIGVLLIVTGLNNRLTGPATPNLVSLIGEDINPSNGTAGFGVWVLAILFIGALGYFRPLRPISNGFLILLFLGIFLAGNGSQGTGFFAQLTNAFQKRLNTVTGPNLFSNAASNNPFQTATNVANDLNSGVSNVSNTVNTLENFAKQVSQTPALFSM